MQQNFLACTKLLYAHHLQPQPGSTLHPLSTLLPPTWRLGPEKSLLTQGCPSGLRAPAAEGESTGMNSSGSKRLPHQGAADACPAGAAQKTSRPGGEAIGSPLHTPGIPKGHLEMEGRCQGPCLARPQVRGAQGPGKDCPNPASPQTPTGHQPDAWDESDMILAPKTLPVRWAPALPQ